MSLNLKERYGLLINNEWVKASDGAEFKVYNPANGEQLAICAEATYGDVDKAVEAATEAFKTWKNVSQVERADYLLKIADAIDTHKEHLAQVETYDNGKPIRETLNVDIPLGADHFRYFAGVLRSEEGSAQVFDENTLSLIVREPIGVVGQVVPWNFPFLMAAWKLAPALAAGCTVVIKPSSHTSLSLLVLGDILKEILPPGVVNIVTGKGSKSGQYILDHPGFSKLAFTGSTEVGLDVYKAASERLIPATLELGGKSANIFFEDANWKQALDGAMLGILFNQGQVCCAGSRIFVQDTIYDKFVAELSALFDKVKGGYIGYMHFSEAGTYTVEFREYSLSGYTVANTVTLNVLDYEQAKNAWMIDIINRTTTADMTPFEKMDAISAYLKEPGRFKYLTRYNDDVVSLAADPIQPFFVTYRWDSSTSPAILGEFAELVGGFDDIHYCFGDYPVGSPSWSIWHYVVKLTIGNETQNYAVCPMGSTGDIEEIKMIDFSDLSNMRKFG